MVVIQQKVGYMQGMVIQDERVLMAAQAASGRRKRSGGNAMLETALMLVPLLAMLFGIFDYAVVVFLKNTMQFAVREGVRYAITSQTISGYGHDASIKQIVMNNSMGFANMLSPTGNGPGMVSITYYNPVNMAVVTGSGSNVGGNIVVVAANGLRWRWMAPVLHNATPVTFSVSSAGIMEATPIGGAPAR